VGAAIYVRLNAVLLPATLETCWPTLVVASAPASYHYISIIVVRYQGVDTRYQHDLVIVVDMSVLFQYDSHLRPVIRIVTVMEMAAVWTTARRMVLHRLHERWATTTVSRVVRLW
jgi:hypothetical protein